MQTTPQYRRHESISLWMGCRGQYEAVWRAHPCHKADPTSRRKLLLSCYKALWSHEAATELCSPGSIGGGQARAGCFCSITDALNLLSSMMGSPGCDFFQVSLHKPLCKLLMESTSFVVYRKESWESGKWKLSVSQVIRDRTGPGIQNC